MILIKKVMGRKLDTLLGRKKSKAGKLKSLLRLGLSRLTVLKNQRLVRSSHSRSDVAQLLRLAQTQRALLRVEHVIKEQDMLDTFMMLEIHCNVLLERITLFENHEQCPEELREAVTSLIFASSRCSGFPELREMRSVFASLYGKEFVVLHDNCGVDAKMIQKMSTAQPSLESRIKAMKEIALAEGITVDIEKIVSENMEESGLRQTKTQGQPTPDPPVEPEEPQIGSLSLNGVNRCVQFSASMNSRHKYKDAVSAARVAFESATFAAAAARVAVELSRSESQGKGLSDENDDRIRSARSFNNGPGQEVLERPKIFHPVEPEKNYVSESSSDSDGEGFYERRHMEVSKKEKNVVSHQPYGIQSSPRSPGDSLQKQSKRVAFEASVNEEKHSVYGAEARTQTEGPCMDNWAKLHSSRKTRPFSMRTRRGFQ
ncbi:hypothetical protein QJS10_CPA06g02194 [Acorus calamus]|uniref:Regulator of Vps4 activity in the MVB pathway protein n=1 Tax=Acorus calamus TaxID=4465 RepID=A0AAV9EK15_ACOCL|nr:hypothetical protein QJS10_CPA06g02194 [Acorus calamus]